MSAGVGKTYAMLKDAQEDLKSRVDIVAGYIEPHGREETESLIKPFEVVPSKEITYEGITLREFDLEAALKRDPHTILVDELAHSNAPGCLHNKRWLDIQALLDAGINVYSTLNIQHLESVSELVSSLSGITVHETVPDSVLREADSIEVVDIPPEELIERLKSGKIYKGDKAETALRNFFKEGSLLALREILLRKAAEKIDRDVIKFRESLAVKDSWATSDRMVLAVGPNRFAKRLIRKASSIAAARKSSVAVVYVQTPHLGKLSEQDQLLIEDALITAQKMGFFIERRFGTDIVSEILKVAVALNASLVVVGKPIKNRIRDILFNSLADDLVRRSGNIDVLLVTGDEEDATPRPLFPKDKRPRIFTTLYALVVVVLCTLLGALLERYVEIATISMIYILGAVLIARRSGRTESVAAAIASSLCLNFFFIDPKYSLTVHNPEYVITLLAMVSVSLSLSGLVARIRSQNQIVESREQRTLALYEVGRKLSEATTQDEILVAAQQSILKLGKLDCGLLIVQDRNLKTGIESKSLFEIESEEFAVAKIVMDKKVAAGVTTDILPGAGGLYLPIQTERELFGVCAVQSETDHIDPEIIPTIELILQQTALCLERLILEASARESQVRIETASMRTLVLSSVSHDFRTPLTVIEAAAEQIGIATDLKEVQEFASLIRDHSKRLSKLVGNALSFAKLEQGAPQLNLEWESLEELIGQALEKYRNELSKRTIRIEYPENLPLMRVDAVLLDQLISNVIENSIIHAKFASLLHISISFDAQNVIINIADDGPGLAHTASPHSVRLDTEKNVGAGLGVSICKMIAKLHGGKFVLESNDYGGATAKIFLSLAHAAKN
ncbi:sensor histidine kinase KdpD [bacterium]|nr:sensor histidine kinase KdpD [bacterium]